MSLKLTISTLLEILPEAEWAGAHRPEEVLHLVYTDTRKIRNAKDAVFVALAGLQNDGAQYVPAAYDLGVRTFIVRRVPKEILPDAQYILVKDTLEALACIAQWNRSQFKGTLVAISGRIGKTTVKEWMYHFLSPELLVTRSPKSYNSQLGIILSLLEMNTRAEVAIIEVKPHVELNATYINELLQPDVAILTASDGVQSLFPDSYYESLFKGAKYLLHLSVRRSFDHFLGIKMRVEALSTAALPFRASTEAQLYNAALALQAAELIGGTRIPIQEKLQSLPELALRMDTFEGIKGNYIINDLYNLDEEALSNALEFQKSVAQQKERIVILNTEGLSAVQLDHYRKIIQSYGIQRLVELPNEHFQAQQVEHSVILIKGKRSPQVNRVVNQFKLKKHLTHVRIDLKAMRKNILSHKKFIAPETKMLLMIKASGYGSEIDKMVQFTQSFGIHYYGVAFVDEGIAIRQTGSQIPVMVMNAEPGNYEACIEWNLEPAIYDFNQLDDFISECIYQGIENYPVHIKLDTGMHRLGFDDKQLEQLISVLKAQPEIRVKSVYSHLVEAENWYDKRFSEHQILTFKKAVNKLVAELGYSFDTHIQNSSGIVQFKDINCSMVRLGIGMYGISPMPAIQPMLEPVLEWYSTISQIKTIEKGQTVGYNRSYVAPRVMRTATIPVGYADGLRRSLSNQVGSLFVHGKECPIVGKVCMDMVMIDVTDVVCAVGDEVEIIGPHQTLEAMAKKMCTIPYEVMTSIAPRVHRLYVEK